MSFETPQIPDATAIDSPTQLTSSYPGRVISRAIDFMIDKSYQRKSTINWAWQYVFIEQKLHLVKTMNTYNF